MTGPSAPATANQQCLVDASHPQPRPTASGATPFAFARTFFQRVAKVYRANIDRVPTEAVAKTFGLGPTSRRPGNGAISHRRNRERSRHD
jgi:hypothetical protein